MNINTNILEAIENKLRTVYDPEFPMVDIFTLGLIYDITVAEEKKTIHITMTFTTAACPMAEMLQAMVKNAIADILPDYQLDLKITFDPMRSPSMIKDDDLKRMFDM
jgi:metal-sulfur cluster biosynthetic enzyme